jgi:hypothetical protein
MLTLAVVAAMSMSACTRIDTGDVGVRVDFSGQVNPVELQAGTWNQTIVGAVLKFPIREIAINVENKHPLTADNSALADFDVQVVYSITPGKVAEIYSTKSKGFHSQNSHGEILLMHNRLETLITNAAQKSVRKYPSLLVSDNREKIEQDIVEHLNEELRAEKLSDSIFISSAQIKSAVPNDAILASSTRYVNAQNDLKIKETEVKIAEAEAKRMQALSVNSEKSIAYMNAQATLNFSNAAVLGKVNTVIVPVDFRGMINVK